VKSAIDNADKKSASKSALERLNAVAAELESDRAAAHGRDAERLAVLAEVLKEKGKK
jgi:hypothetical protein